MTTTSCLLSHSKLSLTSLGRKTTGSAKVKHKIKAVDRLLGNYHLNEEKIDIYKTLTTKIIGQLQEIDVLVDWSPAGNRKNHMLRASIAFNGRSVTIYQEVHPEELLGAYEVHIKFLNNLKSIIPMHCRVNIITDAGFRTEWFELVLNQGWDFTGRILGNLNYKLYNDIDWQTCVSLYSKAKKTPTYVGSGILGKERKLKCKLYLHSDKLNKQALNTHQKEKNKKRKIRSGRSAKEYKKSYETPWVLATSKKHTTNNAKKIVFKYSRRMKIEHDFRSTKNHKTGLGLNAYGSLDIKQKPDRIAILLLLATLAMYILWLIGLAAESKNLHYGFQANTYRHKRVLSLIFLGLQIIEHSIEVLTMDDVLIALKMAQQAEAEITC
jgi:hypothetical protein